MKVLMFGWEFPPHISGGLGTACYGLVKGLTYHDTEVVFVAPKLFGDEDTQGFKLMSASDVDLTLTKEEAERIWKNMTMIGVGSYLVPYLSPKQFKSYTNTLVEEERKVHETVFQTRFSFEGSYGKDLYEEVSRYGLVAAKIAQNQEVDIIHAHDWMTYPAGMAAKDASGKPLVIHVHATEFDRSGEHVNQRVYDIERAGMEAADRVITVSNRTREVVIQRYGINPDKVVTVHNAVITSPEKHKPEKWLDDKVVTFLGRVTYQKGPDYFVEAAAKVLKRMDNVRFVMAGSGDMLNKMIALAAKHRIGDRFHFTGFLKGQAVKDMFDLSDVYVMPSVSEPFGISPLEAMQSRVPVIISKQSGVAEILHHAIKTDFWDVDAIADAIYALLNYDGISNMFRTYAREEVESLKWDNVGFKVRSVYQTVLD
jgi:glycosyltransferase involved in cell wall biosynthesis